LLDKHNFSAPTPTFQFFLAGDCVIHIAKVFYPNEPIQVIPANKSFHFSAAMLMEPTADVIRYAAMPVRQDVNPIVVVAHADRNNQRCFASLNMTKV
jgi:hypothetical protein